MEDIGSGARADQKGADGTELRAGSSEREMPAASLADEDYGFVERQLALVGDRDPLDILHRSPGEAAALFGRARPDFLTRPWAPSKRWSPLDILAHMSLTEWVFGYRTRAVLCDPEPVLPPVAQEHWADRCGGQIGSAADHLQDFAALRRANLRTWSTLTPNELERTGWHSVLERSLSLDFLLRLLAGHDLNHLNQLHQGLPPRNQ